MRTIAVVSVKGGTGKSAVALLLAEYFSGQGRRVLFIDADPQNSSTAYLTGGEKTRGDLARAFMAEDLPGNCTPIRENLDLVASALALFKLRTVNPRTLARMLPDVAGGYDYCIIDTAPTLDGIALNAIHGADLILTPSRADMFDLKTALFLKSELQVEDPAAVWRVLPNFYRPARSGDSLAGQLEAAYREMLGDVLLPFQLSATADIPKTFNLRAPVTRARKYWPALEQLATWIEGGAWQN